MELSSLTWEDARDWAKKDPVVIVPLGATEQHGPHLPLRVDIASATYIAEKVAERTGNLVAPPLNFGFSELWHTFPGTISLKSDTFKTVLIDICDSLIRTGFRKIFLLNGHNPNLIIMQAAAYDVVSMHEDKDISLAVATYVFMAKEKCDQIGLNFRDGTHANEMETSIIWHLFENEIRQDKVKEVAADYAMRRCIAFDKGACIVNKWPDSTKYYGSFGDPGTATAEKGRLYLDALIEDISQFVQEFRQGRYDPIGKDGQPQVWK